MTNNKTLPKDTKFATFDSGNEEDILIEIMIANLIFNGNSFNELVNPVDLFKNKKDKEEMKVKTTNIILDFIRLNPIFAEILNQNNKAKRFLNSLDL